MALIKGKQVAIGTITGGDGITTGNIGPATVTPANATTDFLTNAGTSPSFNAQTQKIVNLLPGTLPTDAVNLSQLTALVAGLSWKDAVALTTTGAVAVLSGVGVIAGVDGAVVAGMRILVKNQLAAIDNGIYIAAVGPWARSADMPVGSDAAGAAAVVTTGTTLADTLWVETADPAIVGTDPLTFTQIPIVASVLTAGLGIDPAQLGVNVIQVLPAASVAGTGAAAVGAIKLVATGVSSQLAVVVPGTGPNVNGGIQVAQAGGLSVRLESPGATSGGLQLVGVAGDIGVQLAPGGGLGYSATGLTATVAGFGAAPPPVDKTSAVGVATTASRSDHTHASPQPVIDNHKMTGTTANVAFAQVGVALAREPAFASGALPLGGSYISVKVNGIQYPVGDGTRGPIASPNQVAFYFSNDAGATARAINAIRQGDTCHLGDYTGGPGPIFAITPDDVIDFDYVAFYP